jgi:Domain of unknown function (DUF6259)
MERCREAENFFRELTAPCRQFPHERPLDKEYFKSMNCRHLGHLRKRNIFAKLLSLTAVYAIAVLPAFMLHAGEIMVENQSWAAAFDTDSGALIKLENKSLHWNVEQHPAMGVSFRLNAPIEGRDNFITGQNQRRVEIKKISAHRIQLRWKHLAAENGDILPIVFTEVISLANDALTFEATLENKSKLTISTVDFPWLGDFNPPAPAASLEARHIWYGTLQTTNIYSGFGKETRRKNFTAVLPSSQSLFCLVQSTNEGIYVEMENSAQPYLLDFVFEKRGSNYSVAASSHLEFFTSHFAWIHPRATGTLVPVVLRGYKGDWHAGVDCYKEWRATWFKEPPIPGWIKQVNSWQQLQINTPEQDYRVPYTNLVQYGRECADNGVGAIQLVGWNHGGQDAGDPSQDTDPGLGTWQQLRDAIAQIQAQGVKMILFAKLTYADRTTAWDKDQLYKYACVDPGGKKYEHGGFAYMTPTQLAGIGVHRRDVMDVLDPAYRDIATKEFKKILALGPAGWLWDEVCHHAGVEYNFAPGHGYTPPGYVYGGDMPLDRQLWAAANLVNSNFLFAGEAPGDWLMQYFPCSYFRIQADSVPVCRYIDPRAPLMVAVTGFDDREMLNLILMDRYIISYEPYNFKGHLTDFPLTLAYGKKIDALRRKYKDYLWDATFRDTLGATVTANGDYGYTLRLLNWVEQQ